MAAQPPERRRKPGQGSRIAKAARAVAAGVAIASASSGASPLDIRLQPDDPLQLTHPAHHTEAVPAVLLAYQQNWIADTAQLKIAEKGRRVGLTWAEAADNVLIAASQGGSNVFYISATQDMAREYIEACAMWARVFDYAAAEVSEGLYDDGAEVADPAKRYIKTYEIVFPKSGKRIVALSSRPTNLRGKQGVIVIDEAAFAPDLAALIKAAMAMLLWGDKVRIISTHDGADNAFNELVQEVRAGKRGGPKDASVHRITFRQAVADGLYRRVCMRRGLDWTAEGEQEWVDKAYRYYGDAAAEELDAVPSQSAGAYLSLALIEQRMVPAEPPNGPALIRGKWDDDFAYLPEDVREHAVSGWLLENLSPHLGALHKQRRHVFGEDFARNRNLTVFEVLEEDAAMVWRVKLQIELLNCPFSCQEQILYYLVDGLPRFRGGAMDAGGNGAALAEKAAQRYGTQMIEQVKLHDGFYLLNMPKFKSALENGTLKDLPRDAQTRDDLRSIKLVKGIPKLPRGDTNMSAAAKAEAAESGEKLKRHGDAAVALFLADYATRREAGELDWTPAPPKGDRWGDGNSRRDRDDDGWGFDRKSGV
ncbi:MAG: terminase family protein [Ramlibacter sp.]|nr:terminase family protein [Ramlibacter sp.]